MLQDEYELPKDADLERISVSGGEGRVGEGEGRGGGRGGKGAREEGCGGLRDGETGGEIERLRWRDAERERVRRRNGDM